MTWVFGIVKMYSLAVAAVAAAADKSLVHMWNWHLSP